MTNDNELNDHADREAAIEEAITDIVETWWDRMTGEDDSINQMLEDLAGKLGINIHESYDGDGVVMQYAELVDEVVRGSWVGLSIKIMSTLQERMLEDAKGNLA